MEQGGIGIEGLWDYGIMGLVERPEEHAPSLRNVTNRQSHMPDFRNPGVPTGAFQGGPPGGRRAGALAPDYLMPDFEGEIESTAIPILVCSDAEASARRCADDPEGSTPFKLVRPEGAEPGL